jgi:hypothetical protein
MKSIGDKVWISRWAGFQPSGKWGIIADSLGNRESLTDLAFHACMYDCGNENCHEWCDILFDDGSWAYHVSECQMFEEEQL